MPKANVNGIAMYYQVHGQGEPLVLITGLGGGHSAWFFQTPVFKRHYRVVTFDSRGIGKTDRPREPYTIATLADDTTGLMDHLGIGKAHMVGVSMGGMVAQEIAINYPERLMKLVLASTTGGWVETGDAPAFLRDLGLIEEGSTRVDLTGLDAERLMESVNSLAFNTLLYRRLVLPLAKVYMSWVGSDGVMEQLRASVAHNALDRLHLIKAPTLVITGTDDRLVPPHSSDVIAGRIPGARLVKIEGGSHALVAEMRGRFNREVLDFLRDG